MLVLPLPPQVYSIANFILFATLLTSLLIAFIPSHGTTFDSGLDGLGKVDSCLNILLNWGVLCIKRHVAEFHSKFIYNLWRKNFKDKIFEESKKTLKSSKIGALKIFRLYGITCILLDNLQYVLIT